MYCFAQKTNQHDVPSYFLSTVNCNAKPTMKKYSKVCIQSVTSMTIKDFPAIMMRSFLSVIDCVCRKFNRELKDKQKLTGYNI